MASQKAQEYTQLKTHGVMPLIEISGNKHGIETLLIGPTHRDTLILTMRIDPNVRT